jgi:hypothetical protein
VTVCFRYFRPVWWEDVKRPLSTQQDLCSSFSMRWPYKVRRTDG